MAEKNNSDDQKPRSWGERAREWFNEATTGRPTKGKLIKTADEGVKKLKKHKRP